MVENLKLLSVGFLAILGIDAVWLGVIAKKFYDSAYAPFERTLRIAPAILVYIALILGIIIYVLPRGEGNLIKSFLYGALFGFIVYGVFDLTNLAVFLKWAVVPAIVDMLWGSFLIGTVSLFLAYIQKII